MRFAVLACGMLTLGLVPSSALAQLSGTDPFNVILTPEFPRPYGTVTISPRSSLIDLGRSAVTITVNGEVVEEGSGHLDAVAVVGGAGEVTTIVVTAAVDGQTHRKELAVRPAEVSLVIEPTSTTHPFYWGASLLASEGGLRLVAVPDLRTAPGTPVPAQNLVYTWRVNGAILQGASGIGKSTLVATAPVRHRSAAVSVMVATQDQSVVAEQAVTLAPVDPLVRIYKTDPLLGPLFNVALKSPFQLAGDEEGFRVVPYYFAQDPTITWSVNGVASEVGRNITVRATGSSGAAQLEAAARHEPTAQSARSSLTVRFGEGSFLNFFGL